MDTFWLTLISSDYTHTHRVFCVYGNSSFAKPSYYHKKHLSSAPPVKHFICFFIFIYLEISEPLWDMRQYTRFHNTRYWSPSNLRFVGSVPQLSVISSEWASSVWLIVSVCLYLLVFLNPSWSCVYFFLFYIVHPFLIYYEYHNIRPWGALPRNYTLSPFALTQTCWSIYHTYQDAS